MLLLWRNQQRILGHKSSKGEKEDEEEGKKTPKTCSHAKVIFFFCLICSTNSPSECMKRKAEDKLINPRTSKRVNSKDAEIMKWYALLGLIRSSQMPCQSSSEMVEKDSLCKRKSKRIDAKNIETVQR